MGDLPMKAKSKQLGGEGSEVYHMKTMSITMEIF
jgi:hypothetical protein